MPPRKRKAEASGSSPESKKSNQSRGSNPAAPTLLNPDPSDASSPNSLATTLAMASSASLLTPPTQATSTSLPSVALTTHARTAPSSACGSLDTTASDETDEKEDTGAMTAHKELEDFATHADGRVVHLLMDKSVLSDFQSYPHTDVFAPIQTASLRSYAEADLAMARRKGWINDTEPFELMATNAGLRILPRRLALGAGCIDDGSDKLYPSDPAERDWLLCKLSADLSQDVFISWLPAKNLLEAVDGYREGIPGCTYAQVILLATQCYEEDLVACHPLSLGIHNLSMYLAVDADEDGKHIMRGTVLQPFLDNLHMDVLAEEVTNMPWYKVADGETKTRASRLLRFATALAADSDNKACLAKLEQLATIIEWPLPYSLGHLLRNADLSRIYSDLWRRFGPHPWTSTIPGYEQLPTRQSSRDETLVVDAGPATGDENILLAAHP